MFAGLFAGSLIISSWNPLGACSYALSVISSNMADNVILLLFTLFMGVGISFIWKLGGSFALAEAAKRRFKKRRSVCLGTWGLGMACSVNDCLDVYKRQVHNRLEFLCLDFIEIHSVHYDEFILIYSAC